MGKNDVGGPKWLANKMKSKGLQKLRWYCQMCAKQCRDENGFKCHTMSEVRRRKFVHPSSSLNIIFCLQSATAGTVNCTYAI